MARPVSDIGTYGKVNTTKEGRVFVARARFRDLDGALRLMQATGTSKTAAEHLLRQRILERVTPVAEAVVTRDTKLRDLAVFWLDEIRLENRLAASTLELYERDTNNLVLPVLGEMRLRELTVGRVDGALKALSREGVSKGQHARVVLSLMMQVATRHGALEFNPVNEIAKLPKSETEPRALSSDELHAVRTAIAEWRTGKNVRGPRPDGQLGTIIEVVLGTSMRIGEVLALRKCDVDVTANPATVAIIGTLVNTKADGLYRQEKPKKSRQSRTVAIPAFAGAALRRHLEGMGDVPPETLLFRSRKGTALWPNNVRRSWRDIREGSSILEGFDLDDVTPHTFRKTVATALDRASGTTLASEMLGHSNEEITKASYIVRNPMVNPATAEALESLAPRVRDVN